MDILHTENWLEQLERILVSSGNRDTGEVIRNICDLAAEMGRGAGEALLEAHPELFAYGPALTDAFRQMISAQIGRAHV